MSKKTVKLNQRELTESEFQKEKTQLENKGVRVVKVSEGVYRSEIRG